MSSILVFGASGAVGRYLLPRLAQNHAVIAVSRSARPQDAGWFCADLADTDAPWPATEAVISLGPLDAFAGWLGHRGAQVPRRILALSSMSVESKRESPDPAERALAARLAGAEQEILELAAALNLATTIFRPTLIYGAGSDRSLAPIARFARRWRVLPIPSGAGGLRQPVHALDLALACLAALDRPATFGKVYALGGGERLRFDTMIRRLRAAVAGPVLCAPLPLAALRLGAQWRPSAAGAVARLGIDLVADNTAAAQDFGYAPRGFDGAAVIPP